MPYWLMKSEPQVFSIDDLAHVKREPWDGVRNYQARNLLRDQIQCGDLAFFYHSNCPCPGIVGIMEIVTAGYPDATAFDSNNSHYDPNSTPEQPRWYCVDVSFIKKFSRTMSLSELKNHAALTNLPLVKRGNRLSVMPVTATEWAFILAQVDQ